MVRKMQFSPLEGLAAAALALFLLLPGMVLAQSAGEVRALTEAFERMRAGDWDGALAAAGSPGTTAHDIIQWNRLRASEGTFAEAQDFLARHPDWPGLKLLRKRAEKTIPEDAANAEVLDYFAEQKPQTGWGSLALARALWAVGEKQAAMAEAIRGWTHFSLSEEEEARFMADWPKTLARHHWDRMDMLLWRGLTDEARRQLPRVDDAHKALAEARIALREQENGVDAAIQRVPAALRRDPGLAYERFLWRFLKGRNESAAELLLERSASAEALGQPERWAGPRAALARWAMRAGRPRLAYRIAAEHRIGEGGDRDDLEWLAGYIALRKLGDGETALRHFRTFRGGVDGPISLARAGYWEGRALEALGRESEARAAYERAGAHQTAFYGLLAAERAGLPMKEDLTGAQTYPGYREARFWHTSVMEAARLSLAAGELYQARRFVIQLSESLTPTEIGQLMQWAEEADAPYLQLALAKYALVYHDLLFPRAYFPTPDIGRGNRTVPRALELAIARRESEFNPKVVSGAGALGLMQLMPGTAQDMADRIEIDFERDRLTEGRAYNTRLGSEYLAYLIETFGKNPVLVAGAYNGGPARVQRWIEAYGDPRAPSVDVIDWIEALPVAETRNYIMRVTESLPVYRARLTGKTAPIRFLSELKSR
ncbi:MAG: lytic transglycosylase domain-containing protein [Alphaproteobacteria bacterium]|nr:MAG: lytic transglycosylase domain-containing protein [Alphaproteobacteria bacterium]